MKFDGIVIAIATALLFILGISLAIFYDAVDTYAEVVSIIRDIIVALVAAIGAILGFQGLGEWQRQFNAKNEHEWARRILESAFRLRDVIKQYRDNVSDQEIVDALSRLNLRWENPIPIERGEGWFRSAYPERRMEGEEYAYRIRLDNLKTAAKDLKDKITESQIFWDDAETTEARIKIMPIFKILDDLYISHDVCFGKESGLTRSSQPEYYYKHKMRVHGYVGDGFWRQVDKVIGDIRDWLRPKLRP